MKPITENLIRNAADAFCLDGTYVDYEVNRIGHINDTIVLHYKKEEGDVHYLLQRLNTDIFTNPEGVISNIRLVTEHIANKAKSRGEDPSRNTLTLIKTREGGYLHKDNEGNCYRCYVFIERARTYNSATPELFYQSAVAFGKFQRDLSDFDASKLSETLVKFHDTEKRFNDLLMAIERNASGRKESCQAEIEFALQRKEFAGELNRAQKEGRLPLRVTHNDTKLNNVMIDDDTHQGIAVIDLDTVMPGLSCNDFGDSIRFGANAAKEDETDLSKVYLDLNLFESYAKGFVEATNHALTEEEMKYLPIGAMMMTYECGIRFLADYLDGDTYFHTAYSNHNLDRARCQFALVKDMENKKEQMDKIIASLC